MDERCPLCNSAEEVSAVRKRAGKDVEKGFGIDIAGHKWTYPFYRASENG